MSFISSGMATGAMPVLRSCRLWPFPPAVFALFGGASEVMAAFGFWEKAEDSF
jgi:hypothetical protein